MPSACKRYTGQSDKSLRQSRFLAAFSVTGRIQSAARLAGIHRQTFYDWMREDPTYPPRFEEARQQAAQSLEDEAVRRAKDGVRIPVLYRGKQVYIQGEPLYQIKYSDELLIRLLEAWLPEKYGSRSAQTNLLKIDPKDLSPSQLDVLIQHLAVKELGTDDPLQIAAAIEEAEAELDRENAIEITGKVVGEKSESSPN